MIDGFFLGTSSMFPTKERAHSCVFIRQGSENILFDCGEGAQRQMRIAGISPMKLTKILLTHWHGDHTLGLGGIIQSLSASGRSTPLKIYGPPGTAQRVGHIIKSFAFTLRFKIETIDLSIKKLSKIIDEKDFYINAMPVQHGIPCIAYSLVEKSKRRINVDYIKKQTGLTSHPILGKLQKGKSVTYKGKKLSPKKATFLTPEKKITYIVDTNYSKDLKKLAKESDILICEATYSEDLEKKAIKYNHLTAKEAAKLAKESKVKKLYLTHFSQRYTSLKPLENEAKKVFKNVLMAKDFMEFKI